MRNRLRRLEKTICGKLDCIELADGSRYRFEPEDACKELFLYWSESLRALYHQTLRPEPAEILKVVARARDRERAFRQAYSQAPAPWCPLESRRSSSAVSWSPAAS
jgi:hypothetical protein